MERGTLSVDKSYSDQRDYVLAVLRRRCGWLAPDEREAIFHDAYAVLLEKERDGDLDVGAMEGNQVRAYLTQTALFKALDEGKRAERNRSEPLEGAGDFEEERGRPIEDSVAAEMEGARVREIVRELPGRRAAIVKLRFFFERTPDEIQEVLGVSSRVYRRELERAVKQIADRYELLRAGRFCDSKRSLLLAYVSGVAGPGKAKEARAHLETCPGCAAWVAEMRDTTRRAAALLPLPLLTEVGARLPRWSGPLSAGREHLSWLIAGAKRQLATRAGRLDPGAGGYLAGTRPGTVAATLAGCLALGGGAYCAVQGVPGGLFASSPPARHKDVGDPRPQAHRPVAHRTVEPRLAPVVHVHRRPHREEAPPRKQATPASHRQGKAEASSRHESHLEAEAAAAEEEFSPAPAPEPLPEAVVEESSSASSSSFPAPSNAAPPPEETPGGEAEFAP